MKTRKMIALADCNNFFVSCEILRNPALKNKPVCVLSNCDGCIISRSTEAKQLGITMGMPLFQAKREFPNVEYISSEHKFYRDISKRIQKFLKNFSPEVEIASIDEAFLDVTNLYKYYGLQNYDELAKVLHYTLLEEIGIPVSIGISTSKVLCKIAVDKAKKSTYYYVLNFDDIEQEISDYPIEKIWSIGRNIAACLRSHGIFTAGDILKKDKEFFAYYLGKHGLELKFGLAGENVLPVCGQAEKPKSIQKTESFVNFTNDKKFLKTSLLEHLHSVCRKLRYNNLNTGEITVMLRSKDFRVFVATDIVEFPTNSEVILNKKVSELFERIYSQNVLYRSTGIYANRLNDSGYRQLSLLNGTERFEQISKVWDKIEKNYGKGAFSVGFR